MTVLATLIYLLCLLTSVVCAYLLIRSYGRYRTGILLWSAACFALLALNNLLMVIDIIVLPQVDLSLARTCCAVAAVGTLLYGFIWELD
ncbi:MAG: hypothetical protein KGJ78_12445 [Alphaproteobacteria bacterium]|nr:hypothetical protein [Alphaproteobacteria bacterium]